MYCSKRRCCQRRFRLTIRTIHRRKTRTSEAEANERKTSSVAERGDGEAAATRRQRQMTPPLEGNVNGRSGAKAIGGRRGTSACPIDLQLLDYFLCSIRNQNVKKGSNYRTIRDGPDGSRSESVKKFIVSVTRRRPSAFFISVGEKFVSFWDQGRAGWSCQS